MSTGPATWAWQTLAGALRETARNGLPDDPGRRLFVDSLRAMAAAESVLVEEATRAARSWTERQAERAAERSVIGPIRAIRPVQVGSTSDLAAGSGHAPITTAELAEALAVSPRHALRRARRAGIPSRPAGRAHLWPFDAAQQLTHPN